MADPIVERVSRKAGVADLVEILAERLNASDLQSLLLEVYRRRAGLLDAASLLDTYARNRFVQPARVAVDDLLAFDQLAFSLLP